MKNEIKRIIIFAHYDKNNIIEDYVVFYLKRLYEITHDIIFVSDSNIKNEELYKIKEYVQHMIIGHHGEYDFGSYKKGFKYLYNNNLLEDIDELIFANDSCYAPLYSFDRLFDRMSYKNIDFWGITANLDTYFNSKKHIQSYFIAFKKNIFTSSTFINFINTITKEKNKKDIVEKYEYGLTRTLQKAGFTWDVYSEYSKKHWSSLNINYEFIINKEKIPFLKRNIPLLKYDNFINYKKLESFIRKDTNYNYSLIKDDIIRNKEKININRMIKILYKTIIRKLLCIIFNIFFKYNFRG